MINKSQIFKIINDLIEESDGSLININGDFFTFKRRKSVIENEIFQYEKEARVKLPIEYCDFLLSVGSCSIFNNEYGDGYVFLSPNEIIDWEKEVLQDDYPIIQGNIILTMSNPSLGYIGGFNIKEDMNNFGIIYPDIPPEMWIDEVIFQSFYEWLGNLLSEYVLN